MGKTEDCLDCFTQKIPIVQNEKTDRWNHCVGIFKYLLYIIPVLIISGLVFVPQWHHQQQPVEGYSIGKVNGDLYSGNLTMDSQDYTTNQNMPDSFFIATQLEVTAQNRCESESGRIKMWCNTSTPTTEKYSLTGVEDLTVLIKNWVVFVGGGFHKKIIKWSNINAFHNESQIPSCRYNSTDKENKYCPIFTIGTILESAKQNMSLMIKGGVINIVFYWECNACESKMTECKPTIKFKRVDNIDATKETGGVNFRHANYYGRDSRDLIKATGIRFIITTNGFGYSFDLVMLILKVGGMLGYTSVITLGAAFLIERIQNCRGRRETNPYENPSA